MIGNRLAMFGSINKSTPACVIIEIAESMKFKVDRRLISDEYIDSLLKGIRSHINNLDMLIEIDLDENKLPTTGENNLRNVARVVNSDHYSWDIDSLTEAFCHIMDFGFGENKIENSEDITELGRKTPSKPLNMDACLIYKQCKLHNIACHRWQSEEDMFLRLKYSIMEKSELIELLCKDISFRRDWKRNTKEIEDVEENVFKNRDTLIKNYIPNNHAEAVYLSLDRFDFDISYSTNPIKIYKELKKMEVMLSSEGESVDAEAIEMAIEYAEDDYLIKLWRRDKNWLLRANPVNEPTDEFSIHLGIHPLVPFSIETTFPNEYPINDIGDILFTIGKLSNPKTLYICSKEELERNFKIRGCFILPHSNDTLFPQRAIDKIRDFGYFEESIQIIDSLREDTNSFIKKIKESPEIGNIKRYFDEIKNLSFIMRGWKDGKPEPLKAEHTITENLEEVEIDYTIQKDKIDILLGDMDEETKKIINDIPLVMKISDLFVRVVNEDVGITIKQKIEIVDDGENDINNNGCIRFSSNYLLETCWFFYKECFDEILFDLEKLRWIT